MKYRSWGMWILAITILMYSSGCTDIVEHKEVEEAEEVGPKEDIYAELHNVTYTEEKRAFNVEYETNVPAGIDVHIKLSSEERGHIGSYDYTLDRGEYPESIQIEVDDLYSDNLSSGNFYIELEIQVVDMNNDNKDVNEEFLFDGLGGQYYELSDHYQESSTVKIQSYEVTDVIYETNYYLSVKSNSIAYENKVLSVIPEQQIVSEKSASTIYTPEFIVYNERYYTSYKNKMDLIADHFELLAVEGFGNRDIVDDLLIWTSEFDELLDVYEKKSIPINEMDQDLHNHTLEMINEQRMVNKNVIEGLTLENPNYFSTAGNHLTNVAEMYLEGYNLIPLQ